LEGYNSEAERGHLLAYIRDQKKKKKKTWTAVKLLDG
jgi:hypothetical protein